MIIQEKNKDLEVVGDIEENKIGVDAANLEHIISLLSTSLYSDPIGSFVREIVSNAWDAHVEAKTKEPVLLELAKDENGKTYCRIQDFGVGLSPERFDSIYRNIGSSTKRGSNEAIGGFGIGRFSALAYSDTVYITSTHDGTKYEYMMVKDGVEVSIPLLSETPTEENNGVEVKVYLKYGDQKYFENAIVNQLSYFSNLYVVNRLNDLFEESFKSFKIQHYKNFSVNTISHDSHPTVLLGKVKYPLDTTKVNAIDIINFPISLRFEIGELDIVPNREALLYSKRTIKAIQDKIDAAELEIAEIFKKASTKDFTDPMKYYNALEDKNSITLLEDKSHRRVTITSNVSKNYTLNGVNYNPNVFQAVFGLFIIEVTCRKTASIEEDKIHRNGLTTQSLLTPWSTEEPIFSDLDSLGTYAKAYLREEYAGHKIYKREDKRILDVVKKLARNKIGRYVSVPYGVNSNHLRYDKDIIRLSIKYCKEELDKITVFTNDDVPKEFIDKRKAEMKAKRALGAKGGINWKQQLVFHVAKPRSNYSHNKTATFESITKSHAEWNKAKMLHIYSEKGDDRLENIYRMKADAWTKNSSQKFEVLGVAPTKIKLMEHFDNYMSVDEFMKGENSIYRRYATTLYIKEKFPDYKLFANLTGLGAISIKLLKISQTLYDYVKANEGRHALEDDFNTELLAEATKHNTFDHNMKSYLDANLAFIEKTQVLKLFISETSRWGSAELRADQHNLIIDYVMSRRCFRPNLEAVIKKNKETIFNIKEEENEDS